ncbi:MAG: competence/damage-inducible protein A [Gammaproteobacteria bacterium]
MTIEKEATNSANTAAVIIIGNEILSGRTQDINLSYMGKRFDQLGINLVEARIVRDVPEEIIEAVNHLRNVSKYVFTTGGIGPTHDDITTYCIAQAFGVDVELNPDAVKCVANGDKPEQVSDARMKMARIPVGATLVDNPVSGAPGYRLENVYVFAGVPNIMQAMFEGVAHELIGGDPVITKTVSAHMRESQIAEGLDQLQNEYPDISIGSYPFYKEQRFGVNVVTRGTDENELEELDQKLRDLIAELSKSY